MGENNTVNVGCHFLGEYVDRAVTPDEFRSDSEGEALRPPFLYRHATAADLLRALAHLLGHGGALADPARKAGKDLWLPVLRSHAEAGEGNRFRVKSGYELHVSYFPQRHVLPIPPGSTEGPWWGAAPNGVEFKADSDEVLEILSRDGTITCLKWDDIIGVKFFRLDRS
ncbi:MAG TPA: hypothetical protein VIL46_02890 [Gemmataceae bacterium]